MTNFSSKELFRVEELPVCTSPHFIHHSGFQVHEYAPRHMLPSSGLAEEGVEGVIPTSYALIRGHLTVRLDAMLQTVEFPTRVTDLDSGLSNVY